MASYVCTLSCLNEWTEYESNINVRRTSLIYVAAIHVRLPSFLSSIYPVEILLILWFSTCISIIGSFLGDGARAFRFWKLNRRIWHTHASALRHAWRHENHPTHLNISPKIPQLAACRIWTLPRTPMILNSSDSVMVVSIVTVYEIIDCFSSLVLYLPWWTCFFHTLYQLPHPAGVTRIRHHIRGLWGSSKKPKRVKYIGHVI